MSGRVRQSIHLLPVAPLAERVIVPGDPGRALHLAQTLLDAPKMFNHNRGLWGYTGTAPDGERLTVQSTGMGGPSAAIVISELADLGAQWLLRVGTCGALDDSLELGDRLIVTEAIAADGTSRALGAGERVPATDELIAALLEAAGGGAHAGPVASTDLFYDDRRDPEQQWMAAGALAVDMETATLFALAHRRGLQSGSVLIVSDVLLPARRRISPDALRDAEVSTGELALAALAAAPLPADPGASR
jgi:DeoD family purine-nucleoside phosphorylase